MKAGPEYFYYLYCAFFFFISLTILLPGNNNVLCEFLPGTHVSCHNPKTFSQFN